MINNGVVIQNGIMDFYADNSTLDFPVSSDSKWQLNDFTIEIVCTLSKIKQSAYPTMFATGDKWENYSFSYRYYHATDNKVSFFWNGVGDPLFHGNRSFDANDNTTFHHLALVRTGNNWKSFIDGIIDVDVSKSNRVLDMASDNLIRLGALSTADEKYFGKIKWVRVSNIARYASNFDTSELMKV